MLNVFKYNRDIDGFQGMGKISSVFLWAELVSVPYDSIQFQWISDCEKNGMICFERAGHVIHFSWSQEAFREEYVKSSVHTRQSVMADFYTSATQVKSNLAARCFCTYSMTKRVEIIKQKFGCGVMLNIDDIQYIQRIIVESGKPYITVQELQNIFS